MSAYCIEVFAWKITMNERSTTRGLNLKFLQFQEDQRRRHRKPIFQPFEVVCVCLITLLCQFVCFCLHFYSRNAMYSLHLSSMLWRASSLCAINRVPVARCGFIWSSSNSYISFRSPCKTFSSRGFLLNFS